MFQNDISKTSNAKATTIYLKTDEGNDDFRFPKNTARVFTLKRSQNDLIYIKNRFHAFPDTGNNASNYDDHWEKESLLKINKEVHWKQKRNNMNKLQHKKVDGGKEEYPKMIPVNVIFWSFGI